MHTFFTVDLGATSGRTVLARLEGGRMTLTEFSRFENPILPISGHWFWNLPHLYNEILKALGRVAQEGIEIESIGIDTWGCDFSLFGSDGQLLGLPYSYRDPHTDGAQPLFFEKMPSRELYGRLWGALFFLFMTFASFSTVIAVFENLLSSCIDNFGWSRKKAVLLNAAFILIASLPCVLGYNLWSGFHPFLGKDVLDSEDFIVSNLLLPIGSLVYLLFCVTKWGWGFDKFLAEANTGSGLKLPESGVLKTLFHIYFAVVLPILILVILVQGLPSRGWQIGVCAVTLAFLALMARRKKA